MLFFLNGHQRQSFGYFKEYNRKLLCLNNTLSKSITLTYRISNVHVFSVQGSVMKKGIPVFALILSLATTFQTVRAEDINRSSAGSCGKLPRGIAVVSSAATCGGNPAVVLTGTWRGIFSAAFRWENGSKLEDRSPFALGNGSASSSPYKTQRRLRSASGEVLCYGNFVRDTRFPLPVQLTVKRTVAPTLNRFCVRFGR